VCVYRGKVKRDGDTWLCVQRIAGRWECSGVAASTSDSALMDSIIGGAVNTPAHSWGNLEHAQTRGGIMARQAR
jgi:hypothetical protein